MTNEKLAERKKRELIRQINLVVNFIEEHNNKFETLELTNFLQDNEIEYMLFNIKKDWKVTFMKNGEIIILNE